jgi:hypothetical protein
MIKLLAWFTRITGLGALVLGFFLWQGRLPGTLRLHMTLGALVAVYLAIISVAAGLARVRPPMALVGLLWAAATVYVGVNQNIMIPGASHWVIEVVHVLLGVGAIGLVEMLAGAYSRQRR